MLPLRAHLFSSLIPFGTFQKLGKVDSNRIRRWVSVRLCDEYELNVEDVEWRDIRMCLLLRVMSMNFMRHLCAYNVKRSKIE